MNSNDGGGTAGPPATFPARSTALNPLRPTAVTIELPADASVSVNGGGISTTPSTSLANLPATGSSKEHCSFCKAVDTALYLCPCGLARYCSTVCQHAHWSLHRTVCGNSVHAVEPSWRRCDWCGRASQTLRRCACGVVYYCDVDCQRADWPYHRLVCSTVGSAAVVAALLGGPAPRTTREAATQTAHWQINVPVRRSIARSDVALDSRGVSGYASTSVPPSQQYAFAESESFAETRFLEGSSSESEPSFPRSNRTQPPPWAHGSPAPGDSALTDASLLSSNSTSATAAGRTGVAGHMDPARRLSPSRVGNVLRPHTSSGRRTPNPHPRPQSFYESLCLTASQQGSSSPSTAHFRSYTDASSTISKGTGHSSVGFTKSTTMSSGIIGAGSRYPYAVSEAEGAGNSSNVSPAISMSPVRDQPSLLAFAATSQRKIESDEQKEWAELCRQFHVDRISIELMVLPKLEEEQRMTILKEEVMWCIVTGYPAAKSLKQRVLRRDK
ncbi:hypothetical protein ABB37_04427 [Leptomonas pyrrhocoris]|uniref:MYND-type domain-containing protein n=1 Tax=Leptomonas pyrrhocoris TaxID=157538 RepID=A0A0M9G2Y2_LEPPY|nr:hypothetical protein ABB37_04427 [Leptomonas pyrrhocoris]KPA81066.1 hypothetical protein ABB37_04427 [Leptomonas pyrrhocoris]|eukprot:XP_015659505.1 hypothetical protein ABB37_04427 [Leptomonas pyrrhocoris]